MASDEDIPPSKTQIHRSFSSPLLNVNASSPSRSRSFNDQFLEFADKFVDTLPKNEIERQSSVSSVYSTISTNSNDESPMINYKTPYCLHRHSCFANCWARGVIRTFAGAYITYTTWSLISKLIRIKYRKIGIKKIYNYSLWKKFFKLIFFDTYSIRFALSLSILSFTYKFLLCFVFRRLFAIKAFVRNEFIIKYIFPAISGFISGFLTLLMLPSRSGRNTVALFCIVRSIGDLLRVLNKMNKLPLRINNFESLIFILFQIPIMYSFMHKPSLMNRTYFKWILNMGALTEYNMNVLRKMFTVYHNNITTDFPLLSCVPIFHSDFDNCAISHSIDWFKGIFRAARIYIPVHWLPLLLLTPKKILFSNKKWYYIKKKSINTLRSSIFLTTYQYNMKMVECYGRKLINSDTIYLSMCGGFASGLAILIEHPQRRSEIILYVLPRAIEIILNIINKNNRFKRNYSILVFAISIAIWMAIRQCDGVIPIQYDKKTKKHIKKHEKNQKHFCNQLNMTVLSVIFGRFH